MKINEIFYSLQGEGARQGEASIFVRLSGCDLACGFCDTEFESGKEMSAADILAVAQNIAPQCRWIVWTGGEPLLQLNEAVTGYFFEKGYKQAIETNGNHPIRKDMQVHLNWVVVSPKVAEHVLAKHFPTPTINELRYIRHANHCDAPRPLVEADFKYLSPQFKGNAPDPAAIERCIRLCLENPEWRLSVQTHKLLRIL